MKKVLLAVTAAMIILTGCGSHYVEEYAQPEWSKYPEVAYASGINKDGTYYGYSNGSIGSEIEMWMGKNRKYVYVTWLGGEK